MTDHKISTWPGGPNTPESLGYTILLPTDVAVSHYSSDAGPIINEIAPFRASSRKVIALVVAASAVVATAVILGVKAVTPKRIGGQATVSNERVVDTSAERYTLDKAHKYKASISRSFLVDEAVYVETLSAVIDPVSHRLTVREDIKGSNPYQLGPAKLSPTNVTLLDETGKVVITGSAEYAGCGLPAPTTADTFDPDNSGFPVVKNGDYVLEGRVIDQRDIAGKGLENQNCKSVVADNWTLKFSVPEF